MLQAEIPQLGQFDEQVREQLRFVGVVPAHLERQETGFRDSVMVEVFCFLLGCLATVSERRITSDINEKSTYQVYEYEMRISDNRWRTGAVCALQI